MKSRLKELENNSVFIIREAFHQFKKTCLLWSMGKDSTCLLWLMRKAFFGRIPFPVIHIDTGFKFKEIYTFRDKYAKQWGLNLIIAKNETAIKKGVSPLKTKLECCTKLKTEALKKTIQKHKFNALYLAIRKDEHGIRAKERIFSPRDEDFTWNYLNQPAELWSQYNRQKKNGGHFRIHPLLGWREIDVWEYIKKERMPVISLYFAKKNKRFRSIGCSPCCMPIKSEAGTIDKIIKELRATKTSERAGRAQDKENAYTMAKLRALGYM